MGYVKNDYIFDGIIDYLGEEDVSLIVDEIMVNGKLEKIQIESPYSRKPIMVEQMSSGFFCVYEQHKHAKRHISIHKTYKGVLGRINVLIDRYGHVNSLDDISSFD